MKCYKRLIYKQFVQVSGLCGPQFVSYLPKRFTQLCRALYGDAILVDRFGPPIGNLSKDVFERRTSTGSEAFSLFIRLDANKFVVIIFFSLIKTIYPRI